MPEPSSPIPSSFDEFEQQQRSFDKIQSFRQALAEQAARSVKLHPGERIVGLIVESDASEAAVIRSALGGSAPGIGGATPEGDLVGVVPRHYALGIAGVVGDEDEAMQDDASGPVRLLPILFVAKTGFRWGCAEYTVDERSA